MGNGNNPAWERIERVLLHSGLSANALAYHIGLKRSENLYQIKKGNHGISKSLAIRINKCFPEFSVAWLLTGEGNRKDETGIPFYEDFSIRSPALQPDKLLAISPEFCNGAEYATIYKEYSLHPLVPSGSYVLLKTCPGEIVFGNAYYIETENSRLFRIVRKTKNDNVLKLVALASDQYDDLSIHKTHIRGLYRICGMFKMMN